MSASGSVPRLCSRVSAQATQSAQAAYPELIISPLIYERIYSYAIGGSINETINIANYFISLNP